jgi:hypothetical protein
LPELVSPVLLASLLETTVHPDGAVIVIESPYLNPTMRTTMSPDAVAAGNAGAEIVDVPDDPPEAAWVIARNPMATG